MTSILLLTSGDKQHGLGHIKRMLVLAESLLSLGVTVGFETPESTPGYSLISKWIVSHSSVRLNDYSTRYETIIIDLENGPKRSLLLDARSKFRRVVVVGGVGFPVHDQHSIDELVDLQIYQSIAINGSTLPASRHLIGCEYLILNPEYQILRAIYGEVVMGKDILILMGGADPHALTDVFCEAARLSVNGNGLGIRTVIGPAVEIGGPLWRMKIPKDVTIFHAPPNLVRAFSGSRMVISALGMTTYEAMCVGVPVASVNWSPDHEETAKKLEALGATANLGQWHSPDWKKMNGFIKRMGDRIEWEKMSERGKELVDGMGAQRVAEIVSLMQ